MIATNKSSRIANGLDATTVMPPRHFDMKHVSTASGELVRVGLTGSVPLSSINAVPHGPTSAYPTTLSVNASKPSPLRIFATNNPNVFFDSHAPLPPSIGGVIEPPLRDVPSSSPLLPHYEHLQPPHLMTTTTNANSARVNLPLAPKPSLSDSIVLTKMPTRVKSTISSSKVIIDDRPYFEHEHPKGNTLGHIYFKKTDFTSYIIGCFVRDAQETR